MCWGKKPHDKQMSVFKEKNVAYTNSADLFPTISQLNDFIASLPWGSILGSEGTEEGCLLREDPENSVLEREHEEQIHPPWAVQTRVSALWCSGVSGQGKAKGPYQLS